MFTPNSSDLLLCDNGSGNDFMDKCACGQSLCTPCMDPEEHECSILSIGGQQRSLDKEDAALQARESSQTVANSFQRRCFFSKQKEMFL
jgi:hypothetical protein